MTISRRTLRGWALVCAGLVLAGGAVCGEEPPSGTPSEVTVKVHEFLKKVVAARRKLLDKRMADEIAEIVKVTGLAPDAVKPLEAAAVTAEDAAQEDFLTKGTAFFAKTYARVGGRGLGSLDRPEVVEAVANNDAGLELGVNYTQAGDQPAWKDAVAHVLNPAQAAAWQKAQDARTGGISKEFDAMIDGQSNQVRTTISSPMFTKSAEIIDTLNLPKERADAVTDLAKKAVEATMEAWRTEARKKFLASNERTRTRIVRGMEVITDSNDNDSPDNQPVWTQGIAKLLSDDDRAKLAASHGTQRQRRTHALAMLMLSLMDDKVAFTTSQRPKLEPIMERLVERVDELYPKADDNGNDYSNASPTVFYTAAAAAKAEELRPILDDLQWKHWQETSRAKAPTNDEEEEEVTPSPTPAKKDAAIEEPEDLERLVSDYIAAKSAVQHKELDAVMLLQAEDAARVAGLPPPNAERLRTAAHGAAEMALATWSSSIEQTIRSQVQGATHETIQQKLSNTNRYYYGQPTPKEQAIWKQATKTDLTPEQQTAWQTERDARAQYGDEAITQYLLAEFDRDFTLSADQWERLAPLLRKALHDYRPDISRMFSYNSPQWFLTSYYMFLPIHAIPEEECKAIVGKDRYERWTGSNGYRYSAQYWGNLRQYHDQRTKEDKK